MKPNLHELAELTGTVPHTLGEVIDAAQQVRRRGAHTVLASLGATARCSSTPTAPSGATHR